jgi:hypothetical protein
VNIGAIVRRAQKATADNAPTILTALGVTGLVTTAVLTGKASFKAAQILEENRDGRSEEEVRADVKWFSIDNNKKFDLTWKLFVPAVGTGAVTIACIVCANHISTRRTAALASAYSIAQEGFREYREKVLEKIGEKKEQVIRDEVAQDGVTTNPPSTTYIVGENEVLFKDEHSGRYFKSTLEGVKKAANDTNYQILGDDYASLSDYWDRLGLKKTSESDEVGWNTDNKLELMFASAITEDHKPCITVEFRTIPVRKFYRFQ